MRWHDAESGRATTIVRYAPDSHFSSHAHPGGEEIFVPNGVFEDEHGRYPKGTWIRNPAGSVHTPFSTEGGTIYVKTGHLSPGLAESGENR